MSRILVLASSYPRFPGDGTAPFVQSISEHLVKRGHEVEVVVPYDPAVRSDPRAVVVSHRFRYAPFRSWHIMGHGKALAGDMRFRPLVFLLLPFFLLGEFWTALAVARRQRTQVVYAHWVLPNGLVGAWLAAFLRLPLLISLHGSDMFVARRNRILGWVARHVFNRAAAITACSPDLRDSAVALGAPPGLVHLIPWGADPERFRPNVPPLARTHFGLADRDIVLLGLGRLVRKKGFDVLVRSLPALVNSNDRVHILVGGTGPEAEQLDRLATDLDVRAHLHLAGNVSWDRVPNFLAIADVFVLPSVRDPSGNLDGLPTVLLEAMASGKPVVATNIAGIPLAIEDQVNGLLCEPNNPAALADALAKLIADPNECECLGRAARTSVERRFNWERVAADLEFLIPPIWQAVRRRET